MTSHRLWSLWDMLQEVDPEGVVKAICLLASESKRLAIINHQLVQQGAPTAQLQPDALGFCVWACDCLGKSAENLRMVGVERSVRRLTAWLQEAIERKAELPQAAIHQLANGMETLTVAFGDELDGRKIFAMTPQYAAYYESDKPLFGEGVFNSFPAANEDIANAGRCLALGCPTACVMHLMRVLEVGLKAVANEFEIENKNDWGTYLRLVEEELGRRQKAAGKRTDDEQFYADACSHFGSLKIAYRNPTMHVGSDYSEERAEEILVATRAFMRHLASRFSSETASAAV